MVLWSICNTHIQSDNPCAICFRGSYLYMLMLYDCCYDVAARSISALSYPLYVHPLSVASMLKGYTPPVYWDPFFIVAVASAAALMHPLNLFLDV